MISFKIDVLATGPDDFLSSFKTEHETETFSSDQVSERVRVLETDRYKITIEEKPTEAK